MCHSYIESATAPSDIMDIYIFVNNETYSSDRLTFSDIRGRTSHQIYRRALNVVGVGVHMYIIFVNKKKFES